jgi:hypothetical protein
MTNEEDNVYITKQKQKETQATTMVIVLLYEYAERKTYKLMTTTKKNSQKMMKVHRAHKPHKKDAKSKHGNI